MINKKKYLSDPSVCPYCGSGMVVSGERDYQSTTRMDQTVTCDNCHKKWTDVFTLTRVLEDGE